MKKIIGLSLLAFAGALVLGHRWAVKKAKLVFPVEGEWIQVETSDPDEFGAPEGRVPEIYPFGLGRS